MKLPTILLLSFAVAGHAIADDREKTLCGFIQERFVFWLWSSIPPKPDSDRALISRLIEPAEFTTADDKTLRGYQYLSHNKVNHRVPPQGYILMALGNAMIADQIIASMKYLSSQGYDVYIFDYRGYGNSEGRRRIHAMIEDYKEIIAFLNTQYDKHLLYGISLGGAIILNAIGSGIDYDLAVIDSSPSRFSDYGCPERIDPIHHLPNDASRLFVITGKKDQVLSEEMTSTLRVEAEKRGAKVLNGDFNHPYMERDFRARNARRNAIRMFFTQTVDGDVVVK